MQSEVHQPAPESALLRAEIFADPYPLYEMLRSFDPVHWDPSLNAWVVTRHTLVSAVLHDTRFVADRVLNLDQLEAFGLEGLRPLFTTVKRMLLFRDPPDHTRLRGLVNKAFTPRVVESMRDSVQRLVDELLDAVQPRGRMDVIADLAVPLPTTVIAQLLGVPPGDRDRLKVWSDDFGLFIGTFVLSNEQLEKVQQSMLEFIDYFRGQVEKIRKSPNNSLLSGLANATEHGDRLTEDELWANCILLLAAGHETTTNLIGNGTLALLRNPEQLGLLGEDPSLIAGAVEELLRYDSPVQITGRVASEELELGGKKIEAGQHVVVVTGAANRDPERFPDPNRLDITRKDNRHMSFGYGPHFCLGAPLARLEGQIAISTMLRRFPNLRLAEGDLHWHENQVLHGLKSLPVEF